MRFKILEKLEVFNSIDKDYRRNIDFIQRNNLNHKLLDFFSNSNLNRVIFISGFTFFMTLYTALMDYVSSYSSQNELALSAYRIIDPAFCVFSLFLHILARFARTNNNIKFSKIIIYTFLTGAIVNYAMVSSIEQYDFRHHPSFVFTILLMSILFYIKPEKIIIFYIIGIVIIRFFHLLFGFDYNAEDLSYSVTIFSLPLSMASSKIIYNNSIRIFADKFKLEKINKSLEIQIDDRTKELAESNEELKNQLEVQKKHEETLEIAKEKAERSDRLKSAFLSNLSHEIRTPLNSIIGFSSLLNNPKLDPVKTKRYTGLITSCGKELVFIIDQLVEMSKIESGEVEINKLYFMVNDLLYEIQEKTLIRLRELKKEHISFSIDNPCYERNIRLYSDLNKIKQILDSLVENSIKFTEKGKIEIGFLLNEDKNIIFRIKDSGIGISAKDKEILFNQFIQGQSGISRKYGGLGLGLSISKTYTELLGGQIWFESEEGKGTTFFFSIPVY